MESEERHGHKEHHGCKKHGEHEKEKEHHRHDGEHRDEHSGKKGEGRSAMNSNEEKGEGMKMDGIHIKKRDLWMVAGGALGVVAALGLGKLSSRARPVAVGAVREGYAFKEWLAGKTEKVKEDVEDIVAEGVHQYHSGLAATADAVKRERSILEKIEKVVEEKLAKMKPEQGEE